MKTLITLALMTFSCSSFAWSSHEPVTKEYLFKFKMAGQILELKHEGQSYEDAYEKAAKECFHYFKGNGKVSENRGLDIIDVCANPRS